MAKRRKRKLKKGFRFLLWVIFLLLIVGGVFYLNQKQIINLNNIWTETNNQIVKIKNFFQKDTKEKHISKNEDGFIQTEGVENDFVRIFRNRLPSKNLDFASSSEVYSNGDMKIFIQETKDSVGYLYINTNSDAEYVWITFVSAIDSDPLKTELRKKIKDLDYIDLRFSNKVFYKFHEEKEILEPIIVDSNNTPEFHFSATTTPETSTSTDSLN